jgi:hypothetical protein
MLKRLIRDRLGDARQHRLHRLAIAVAEHALHIVPQGESLRAMTEATLEGLEPAQQPLNARGRGAFDQRASA